jgi:hypothetical protein
MALVINDRVKVTSTTTGTGAIALGTVATGFITFATGIGNNNTTYYAIHNQGTAEWEVGLGTLDATSANLARTTVLDNSDGNTSAITLSAGTKDVFCTLPAAKAVYLDSTGAPVGAASAGFALAMAVAL